jgi:hypothetical protein
MSSDVVTFHMKYVRQVPAKQERKPKPNKRETTTASRFGNCREETSRIGSRTTAKSVRVLIIPAAKSEELWLMQLGCGPSVIVQ